MGMGLGLLAKRCRLGMLVIEQVQNLSEFSRDRWSCSFACMHAVLGVCDQLCHQTGEDEE